MKNVSKPLHNKDNIVVNMQFLLIVHDKGTAHWWTLFNEGQR